jgi:hypothetical protein
MIKCVFATDWRLPVAFFFFFIVIVIFIFIFVFISIVVAFVLLVIAIIFIFVFVLAAVSNFVFMFFRRTIGVWLTDLHDCRFEADSCEYKRRNFFTIGYSPRKSSDGFCTEDRRCCGFTFSAELFHHLVFMFGELRHGHEGRRMTERACKAPGDG